MEIPKGYSLSSCPFCGSDQLRMYPFKAALDVHYKVECYCVGSAEGRTPEEAIGCWNARAPKAQTPPQPIFDEAAELSRLLGAAREMLRIAAIANQGSNAYNRAIVNLHEAVTVCAQSRAKAGEDE